MTVVPPRPLLALVTTPVVELIAATPGLLLVHVPKGTPLLLSVVIALKHMTALPVISVGNVDTVTV